MENNIIEINFYFLIIILLFLLIILNFIFALLVYLKDDGSCIKSSIIYIEKYEQNVFKVRYCYFKIFNLIPIYRYWITKINGIYSENVFISEKLAVKAASLSYIQYLNLNRKVYKRKIMI